MSEDVLPTTSPEKVRFIVYALLEAEGPVLASIGRPLADERLARLPADPRVLDAELVRHAEMLLALRSDAAPAARVVLADLDTAAVEEEPCPPAS